MLECVYIIYARDIMGTNMYSIDIPIEGTVEDLFKALNNPKYVMFQGTTIHLYEYRDTTLADLGICPETTIEFKPGSVPEPRDFCTQLLTDFWQLRGCIY